MANSFSSTNFCAQTVAVRQWTMFVFISNATAIYLFTKCEIISYSRWKKLNQTNGWTCFVCCYTWIFHTLTYLLWLCMALGFSISKTCCVHSVSDHLCRLSYVRCCTAAVYCKQDAYVLDTQIHVFTLRRVTSELLHLLYQKPDICNTLRGGFPCQIFCFVCLCLCCKISSI